MESNEQSQDRRANLNIGIDTLLKALELKDAMNKLVVFQAKQRALNKEERHEFINKKFDELEQYVNEKHDKEKGTTAKELKTLIQNWIANQTEIANQQEFYFQKLLARQIDTENEPEVSIKEIGKGREQGFQSPEEIEVILSKSNYSLISAGKNLNNQADANKQPEFFRERHNQLKTELINRGFVFTKVLVKNGERKDFFCVMIHDIELKETIEIATAFNQESVIFVNQGKNYKFYISDTTEDGTVITKGSFKEGESWRNVDAKETDFYTEMNVGKDKKVRFSLNFNDKLNPPSQNEFMH